MRSSKQDYKQELSKGKAEAKINKQKDQADKDIIVRNQKHEQRMERFKDWEKHWENITALIFKKATYLATFVVSSLIAILFLAIPYSTKLQSIVFGWLDAVNALATQIKIIKLDNQDEFFPAFANYTIFYIFLIAAIWMIVFLCRYIYKVFTRSGDREKEQNSTDRKNFLEEYDTAIAILTVFTACPGLIPCAQGSASLALARLE